MNDTRENEKTPQPQAPQEQAAPGQPLMLEFPEDKIAGHGFMQYNKKTGWFWIGLKLPLFNFRTAWAFIKSAEYQISVAFDEIEGQRLRMMNIGKGAAGGKPNGTIEKALRALRGG